MLQCYYDVKNKECLVIRNFRYFSFRPHYGQSKSSNSENKLEENRRIRTFGRSEKCSNFKNFPDFSIDLAILCTVESD